jgi:ATP phosphoribosyltransferase regulatory subunit
LNFSIANNADYYNGIIFNGYISGIPRTVLSGGRYDKLLDKFGKNVGAIGFALYLGELERYFKAQPEIVDYLVTYDNKTQLKALKFANDNIKNGNSVRLSTMVPKDIQYKNLIDLTFGGNKND